MRGYSRSVGNPPHTPAGGCSRACTSLEHQNGTLPREIGPQPAPPIPPTLCLHGCIPSVFRSQKQAKITQKQHPSAVPGPCCSKGFPRLCSLSLVICVSFRIQNRKNTRITTDSSSPGVQAENSNSQSARYLQHLAWPAAAKNLKIRTPLQRQAGFAQKASPVCARCPS